jgi:hypothetical protein
MSSANDEARVPDPDVERWIDNNQAKVFVGIGLSLVLAFAIVVFWWGSRPIDFPKLEALGYSLGLGAGGTASAIVVLWLLYAHKKAFWGQAADSITFILDPAVDRLSFFQEGRGQSLCRTFSHHQPGEHATHPIARLLSWLALLLLVAGRALRPRRA